MYSGDFKNQDDVLSNFNIGLSDLKGLTILLASYTSQGYEGEAFVLLCDNNNNLFEVNSSHCSCYGLEGAWNLEKTTIEALNKRSSSFFQEMIAPCLKSIITHNILTNELQKNTKNAPARSGKKI